MKLNEKAFALTTGIVAAACSILGTLGLSGMMGGYGGGMMYGGFGGGLTAIIFAFIFGLVFGYIFAWVYNSLAKS